MAEDRFIGIGHNPNGVDLPTGLGMQLAQEPRAMDAFGRMTPGEKAQMVRHIQGAKTGEDARERIAEAVCRLRDNGAY